MSISREVMLLHLIDTRGSFEYLLNEGISYSQISTIITQELELGNIDYDEEGLFIVTEKGKEFLRNNLKFSSKKNYKILPQQVYYEKPIPIDTIKIVKGKVK